MPQSAVYLVMCVEPISKDKLNLPAAPRDHPNQYFLPHYSCYTKCIETLMFSWIQAHKHIFSCNCLIWRTNWRSLRECYFFRSIVVRFRYRVRTCALYAINVDGEICSWRYMVVHQITPRIVISNPPLTTWIYQKCAAHYDKYTNLSYAWQLKAHAP